MQDQVRGPSRPALASQGIKNLANRAMTSKTDWVGNMGEVGLLLIGVGTAIILVSLISLIRSMMPR
jgi:hypothetical protein